MRTRESQCKTLSSRMILRTPWMEDLDTMKHPQRCTSNSTGWHDSMESLHDVHASPGLNFRVTSRFLAIVNNVSREARRSIGTGNILFAQKHKSLLSNFYIALTFLYRFCIVSGCALVSLHSRKRGMNRRQTEVRLIASIILLPVNLTRYVSVVVCRRITLA